MHNLEFYQLGDKPDIEAIRIQHLYEDDGLDSCVRDEFEATVRAYTTLPLEDIARRVQERYTGTSPLASGALAVYDGMDIGMAVWGKKAFQNTIGHQKSEGINVSAWLLKQHRTKGFGQKLIEYATRQAFIQSTEQDLCVWTSIKPENKASRQACERTGFAMVGIQPDKPERLLYILQTD